MLRRLAAAVGLVLLVAGAMAVLGDDKPAAKTQPSEPSAGKAEIPLALPIKAGEQITLARQYGGAVAPGLPTLEAYGDFLRAVESNDPDRIRKALHDAIVITKGTTLRLVTFHASEGFPLVAPAVEVEILDGPDTGRGCFLPAQYFREPRDPAWKAEYPIPTFAILEVEGRAAQPGDMRVVLTSDGTGETAAAHDEDSLSELVKAFRAKDDIGVKELIRERRASRIPAYTVIRILERSAARPATRTPAAVEGRVLNGPLAPEVVWVPESWTAPFVWSVMRNPRAPAAKKRAIPAPPLSAARRASAAYRAARQLEADGKLLDAVAAYRKVAEEYAAFPEARLANNRIKSLTSKP